MLYRLTQAQGAEHEEVAGSAVAMRYGKADELAHARSMGIADLSTLPRAGFKGKDTPQWLAGMALSLPSAPNLAVAQRDGVVIARLSFDEHLVLGDLHASSATVGRLTSEWRLEPNRLCFMVPRSDSHCWLALTGSYTPEMLAKVCGVDMRLAKFASGSIAQTSIARINGIIIRADLGQTPVFHVLADSASAEYLWSCLCDAMAEFQGAPVGLTALRALHTAEQLAEA